MARKRWTKIISDEDAPDPGVPVLIYSYHDGMMKGEWDADGFFWSHEDGQTYDSITHWHHLPEPPY